MTGKRDTLVALALLRDFSRPDYGPGERASGPYAALSGPLGP